MTDIEERFAGNGDDGSLIERQLPRRASVERESRCRPTENRFANLSFAKSHGFETIIWHPGIRITFRKCRNPEARSRSAR